MDWFLYHSDPYHERVNYFENITAYSLFCNITASGKLHKVFWNIINF